MTTAEQSRLHILDSPVAAPGHCVLCGSVGGEDDRKFLDFGKFIKWFGVVYFCTYCFREFANAAGFIPVADFDNLHNSLRDLQVKYDQMEAKYKPVADVLANFNNSNVSNSSGVSVPDYIANFTPASDTESGTISESTEGESETNESDSVERSDDLFDPSDLE